MTSTHPLGLVTVTEICQLLRVSRPTFERLVRNPAQGFPPMFRLGAVAGTRGATISVRGTSLPLLERRAAAHENRAMSKRTQDRENEASARRQQAAANYNIELARQERRRGVFDADSREARARKC